MANVLDKELIYYFTRLNESQKKSLLDMMKSFLKLPNKTLEPMTIEEYNKELDEAMARIDAGEFVTLEELAKEMKEW
jgi:hypothetical protein